MQYQFPDKDIDFFLMDFPITLHTSKRTTSNMPIKKTKILLVHPLGVNWIPGDGDMSRIANIMPPIGLCSLSAYLEKQGVDTFIYDCYANPNNDGKIVDYIKNESPDYAGFSTTTSSFLDAVRIAEIIKKAKPEITTIFGGVHISALREKLLDKFTAIDIGVVGEGEQTLLDILNSGGEYSKIKGVIYRDKDASVFTGRRENLVSLDDLPFPAYEKLEGYPKNYTLPIFNYPSHPGTPAITARGCPYQCAYCDRSVFGKSFRYNSAEYMFEMARHLNKKFGIKHINFYDDLFTLNKKRLEDFAELIKKNNFKLTYNCATRPEHVNPELLKTLKNSGCWMISLGVESGDEEFLSGFRHNSNLELVRQKVREIKEAKIRTKGLFMVGLPGETEETINKTIAFAVSLGLDDLNVTKFTPFPGSPVYENLSQKGAFEEKWELMNCNNFVFIPNGMTKDLLEKKYREFYRSFFQQPKVLLGYVKMIWKSPNSWLRFLKNLRDFMRIRKKFEK